jgi:hypothetical protein
MHDRLEWWRKWRDETTELIAERLWPVWRADLGEWEGASKQQMFRLTETDIEIVKALQTEPAEVNRIPQSPLASSDCPTHENFFRSEDTGDDWFSKYKFYDRTLDAATIDILGKVLIHRVPAKISSAPLQFKLKFQRPRHFQTAFLLRKSGTFIFEAISAGSPSMCSGHCLQSLLGVGAVYEYVLLNKVPLSEPSITALMQFAVDIGDRRVFAGVHYPADNLSSWIIGLRLANHVYRTREVRDKLWLAIEKQSRVYATLAGHDVYAPALDALRYAAESS